MKWLLANHPPHSSPLVTKKVRDASELSASGLALAGVKSNALAMTCD